MGTQLDTDKSEASFQYKKAILKIGNVLVKRLTTVWLHSNLIFSLSSAGKIFNDYIEIVQSFADNVIKERRKTIKEEGGDMTAAVLDGEIYGGRKRLAMLDLLLAAEAKGEIDLEGIKEEVNTFMFEVSFKNIYTHCIILCL